MNELKNNHMFTKEEIVKLLPDYDQSHVEKYAAYCSRLLVEKHRDGGVKNPWMQYKEAQTLADLFKRVAKQNVVFDGVHITLQSTGISFDYIAHKNKMLNVYPESKIDMNIVYEGDEFKTHKENGKLFYTHKIANPFAQSNIVGAYCVIINKRGEFMTMLSKEEIEKHRKVARTDYIWRSWPKEMTLKTVIKKACKQHFDDVYEDIESMDNENYNIKNPLDIDLDAKNEIDNIKTMQGLKEYYESNKGKGKAFDKYVTIKKEELSKVPQV